MLNKIIEELKKFSLAIILYGSYNKKYFRKDSDIDICVVLGTKEKEKIRNAFEKILELMQDERIDIKIFELLPLYIQGEILEKGKIIYIKDKKRFYEYIWPIIKLWEDEKIRLTTLFSS